MNVQVAEEEEDRCDQAEDKKPPTEEVIDKDDEKSKTEEAFQECEEPSPPCEFSWYATQWSQCSSKCAGMMGLQTRLEDVNEDDNVDEDDGDGGDSGGYCNLGSKLLTGLCFAELSMTMGL